MPISTTSTPPGVPLPGLHVQADLGAVEGRRCHGPHRLGLDLARRRVDARRHVARDHRRVLPVDRRDGRRHRLPRRPLEARAEQRVDDRGGAMQPLRVERLGPVDHLDLAAVLRQEPRRHAAVAAVVALAGDDADRPRPRDLRRHAGKPQRGTLHQVVLGHALLLDRPGVRRAHLRGLEERVDPGGELAHEGATGGRIATAPATSLVCVSEIASSPPSVGRAGRDGAAQPQLRRRARGHDLHVAKAPARQPERLRHSLLGAEARREVHPGPRPPRRVFALGVREQALGEPRPPLERALEAPTSRRSMPTPPMRANPKGSDPLRVG